MTSTISEILQLRAIAQIALTTHITPRVRSISLSIDSSILEIIFRAYSDGPLPESALEALHCAVTEIQSSYPLGWKVKEEHRVLSEPHPMEHLPLVVYGRCEDDWVDRSL